MDTREHNFYLNYQRGAISVSIFRHYGFININFSKFLVNSYF